MIENSEDSIRGSYGECEDSGLLEHDAVWSGRKYRLFVRASYLLFFRVEKSSSKIYQKTPRDIPGNGKLHNPKDDGMGAKT